jgi:Na+/proline symporter
VALIRGTPSEAAYRQLVLQDSALFISKKAAMDVFSAAAAGSDRAALAAAENDIRELEKKRVGLRSEAEAIISAANNGAKSEDKDFVFINFVLGHVPRGLVGLMLAMIFCAAWSTTASELSALSATAVSDIYRRLIAPGRTDEHYLKISRWTVAFWGVFIVLFAMFAALSENLIQAVNMIGSLFYGTILGIFFTAFFLKKVGGRAVLLAAVITEIIVVALFFGVSKDAFLWYNPLGCGLVMLLGWLFQRLLPANNPVVTSEQS